MSEQVVIEAAILAECSDRWQKVAMVIVKAIEPKDVSDQQWDLHVAAIKSLVREGKLDALGDPSEPRHSEVRLSMD
ncbi:hypothetical protein [Bosea sp. (in: a-proteobacteria)]|uniref:hypothetical protein n=1 Tax=Bosea sp. (in: a-proteobacteria) TaxID=1871050 RepID=UPI002FC71005